MYLAFYELPFIDKDIVHQCINYHDISQILDSIHFLVQVSFHFLGLMIHVNNYVKSVHRFISYLSKIKHILEIPAEKCISQQYLFRPSGYPHRSYLTK